MIENIVVTTIENAHLRAHCNLRIQNYFSSEKIVQTVLGTALGAARMV